MDEFQPEVRVRVVLLGRVTGHLERGGADVLEPAVGEQAVPVDEVRRPLGEEAEPGLAGHQRLLGPATLVHEPPGEDVEERRRHHDEEDAFHDLDERQHAGWREIRRQRRRGSDPERCDRSVGEREPEREAVGPRSSPAAGWLMGVDGHVSSPRPPAVSRSDAFG